MEDYDNLGILKVQRELARRSTIDRTESSTTFTFVSDLHINIRSSNIPIVAGCVFHRPQSRENFGIEKLAHSY